MTDENLVRAIFEADFLASSLEDQITACHSNDMAPIFLRLLPDHQPALEAGCGSGRWMHWLKGHGIQAAGLDWSANLKTVSEAYDPEVSFVVADMRAMPLPDQSFGSIISLGSVEHVIEGPQQILQEYRRVLKPKGLAIITVPYYSPFRILKILRDTPKRILQGNNFARKLFGKQKITSRAKLQKYKPNLHMDLSVSGGELGFYQYHFSKPQFERELIEAGFEILELTGVDLKDGIFHNFGPVAAKALPNRIALTPLGRLLEKMLNPDLCGHMLMAVVTKT